MGYQALYRVWRPQLFSDVIGQKHVTKTLQNALVQEKISHAYLFSGPRGTGKTSVAKILAKAVNCEHSPVQEPCNECPACTGITDGSISDVIEIDAASNNGVDEIRDIRDKVKYAPNAVKYKVYIIDEVHMLSTGAFNALLKTLEEPPRHVIFILATTEPHKIPLTIISRCQRFDFKRIGPEDIVERMDEIVTNTGAACDEQALQIIARAAEGGMRDALSLLDQAISFSTGDRVTVEDALTITGSASQVYLGTLVNAIHDKNVAKALELLKELLSLGKDPVRLIEDLILYFRDMLLYQVSPQMTEAFERVLVDDAFTQLADAIPAETIYRLIEQLNQTQQEMKWTNHPRIFMEVLIVKLCHTKSERAKDDPSLLELQSKIRELENELRTLKAEGVKVQAASAPQHAKAKKPAKKSYKAPTGRIHNVLKEATKQDLQAVKSHWGELLGTLGEQNMKSAAALLNEAEPVAASAAAFVVKFKYEIHCQMAMENASFIESISSIMQRMTGNSLRMEGVPDGQWQQIREEFLSTQGNEEMESPSSKEEEPLVAEARKLFGDQLVEIKD